MKPDWFELARLLADHPDIIIATMDTDENENDPYYLPEKYVPNIKLFKKNDKRNYIPYNNGERTVAGFIEFLGRETGLQLAELMAAKYPEYRKSHNVEELLQTVATVLQQYAPPNPASFLCNYFSDAGAFPLDRRPPSAPRASQAAVVDTKLWLGEIERALSTSLPENPTRFLASHFFPEILTMADHQKSPFGFKPLDRSGVEMLTPQQEFECWPGLTRALTFYKVCVCVCVCVDVCVCACVCMCVCVCVKPSNICDMWSSPYRARKKMCLKENFAGG